jgi:hypothetical protein
MRAPTGNGERLGGGRRRCVSKEDKEWGNFEGLPYLLIHFSPVGQPHRKGCGANCSRLGAAMEIFGANFTFRASGGALTPIIFL